MRIFLVLFFCVIFVQDPSAQWKKIDVGTLAWLRSVYFLNETQGWIVGSSGTFLTTSDGGESWKAVKNISKDDIRDVFFLDEQNGWLLCERNIYDLGREPASYLLKTSDGGSTWIAISLGEGKNRIIRFAFSKKGKGIAFGEGGTVWHSQEGDLTWRQSVLPTRNLLLGGMFFNDDNAIVVGTGGAGYISANGPTTWNKTSIGAIGDKPRLNSVFFVDQNSGWAVGANGKIFVTMDQGKHWNEQVSNVSGELTDIFCLSRNEGVSVGSDGTILSTTTAGKHWKAEPSDTMHKLEKVSFAGRKGFAVGFGGTVLVRGQ